MEGPEKTIRPGNMSTKPQHATINPTKVYFNQVMAVCAVALGPLAVGIGKGYSSPALASILLAPSSNETVSGSNITGNSDGDVSGRESMNSYGLNNSPTTIPLVSYTTMAVRNNLPNISDQAPTFTSSSSTMAPSHFVSYSPISTGTDYTTTMTFLSRTTTSDLNSSNSPSNLQELRLSFEEASWLPATSLLGACLASLPCGLALTRLPRRSLMYCSAAAMVVAWSMMVLTVNTVIIYTSALLSGACAAFISLTADLYVAEVAPSSRRASYLLPLRAAGSAGQLLSWLLGAWLSWKQLAAVAVIVPVLLLLALWQLIPESPLFLVSRGRHDAAQRALKRLCSANKCASEEDEDCTTEISPKTNTNLQPPPSTHGDPDYNQVDPYLHGEQHQTEVLNHKRHVPLTPIAITCAMAVVSKCSGAAAFHFYAAPFLLATSMSVSSAHYVAVSTLALQTVAAALLSGRVVDRWGRRPALISGCIVMATGSAVFGCVHFYLSRLSASGSEYSSTPTTCNILAVSALMLVQLAHALCVAPVVHLLIAELFPMHQRGWSSVPFFISYACSFISVKSHVTLQQHLGLYGVFWVYSSVSIVGLYFVCLAVPETKGKQLGQTLEKCSRPTQV